MSEFAGFIYFDGTPPSEVIARALAAGLDGKGIRAPQISSRPGVLFVSRAWSKGRSVARRPLLETSPDGIFTADARLDDRHSLIDQLGLNPAEQISDEEILAAAYARWSETAAEKIYGDFVVAQWDGQRLLLARDALGVRTLYYTLNSSFIAFSTRLQALLALPNVGCELDELILADYLTVSPIVNDQTVYRDIYRVPMGATLTIRKGNRSIFRYWTLDKVQPKKFKSDDDYVEEATRIFERAIVNRLPSDGNVASTLSGGFDSAAVTATAAGLLEGGPISSYTRVPFGNVPKFGPDERALAAMVATRYTNIEWNIVDGGDNDYHEAESGMHAARTGILERNSYNLNWYAPLMQKVSQTDASVLLVGDMGNATLSWHGFPALFEIVYSGQWLRAFSEIRALSKLQGRTFSAGLKTYFLSPLEPEFVRRLRLQLIRGAGSSWSWHSAVSSDFLKYIGYEAHLQRTMEQFGGDRMTGRQARFLVLNNELVRDIDGLFRVRYGFEKRDPYSDRRLAEFCLGIPQDQFFRNGETRRLARRVLADRLPKEILSEYRKGKQASDWYTIASRRREDMALQLDRIEKSSLASRVLDVKKMRQLLNTWPKDAQAARSTEHQHCLALQRGIAIGSFLRCFEAGHR